MKRFGILAVIVLVLAMLVPVNVVSAAGNKHLKVKISYGQIVSGNQISSMKITAMPMASKMVYREWTGYFNWEYPAIKVGKLPFLFTNDDRNGWPTSYLGLNSAKNITFLSSTWDKIYCQDGVIFDIFGNGKTMTIKIRNTGKAPLHIIGSVGSVWIPGGGNKIVSGNFRSGGFDVMTKYDQRCSSLNWDFSKVK